jgi:PIN domain nuclease of toxin-antitoxin system
MVVGQGCCRAPHKDPFDRMLIAQALAENPSIVSDDAQLDGYGAKRVW